MDGKNSSGRRISLLNDNPSPSPHPPLLSLSSSSSAKRPHAHAHSHSYSHSSSSARLPSITPSLRSRTSSYTSSASTSPPTPPLVRSSSSDSHASDGTMPTPSPMTPDFASYDLPSHVGLVSPADFAAAHGSFFPTHHRSATQQHKELAVYPSMSQNATGPLYTPNVSSPHYGQASAEQTVSATQQAPTAPTAHPRSKKNSYPCPVAKLYNCSDHFTTSGHAARHAKKHTGKKDAFCPECNKAFTRKDNMEQHRRTHQSGRNASKVARLPTTTTSDNTALAIKKAAKQHHHQQLKRPKPAPLQSSHPTTLSPLLTMSDAQQPFPPASPSASSYTTMTPIASHASLAYPDPTAFSMTHGNSAGYSIGSSYGLDALAIAASGEKRNFEL